MSGPRFCLPALAAALALCACRGGEAPKGFDPKTYTYLTLSLGATLDPAWANDASSMLLIMNVYEPLFRVEGASGEKIVPVLAEEVPTRENGLLSADERIYTIPIRKGVRFHDGSQLTPEDVRYSLLRFMLMDRDGGRSDELLMPLLGAHSTRDAKGTLLPGLYERASAAVRVQGDAVVLTLAAPDRPFLARLFRVSPVLCKAWAAKLGDWDGSEATWTRFNRPKGRTAIDRAADGTGPFFIDAFDPATNEVVLKRNDAYRRGPAKLERVVIRAVPDLGARKLLLQAGEADDILADVPDRRQVKDLPGVELVEDLALLQHNPLVVFGFELAVKDNPLVGSGKLDGRGIPADFFADKDVRKGFAYAMDYDGFIRDVIPGSRAYLIPESVDGHDPSARLYELDLKKARAHFEKALGGRLWRRGFRLALVYNLGNVPREVICRILKSNIESLNPKFKIDVVGLKFSELLEARRLHRAPVAVTGISVDVADAHDFAFGLMHSQGEQASLQGYASARADKLIDAALREPDAAKRRALYQELQELAFDDVPHLLIVDSRKFRTQRRWVKGWTFNPLWPTAPYGSDYYSLSKEP